MKKIKCILPRLHDYDGDISKKWFVFYSIINPETGRMKRFKVYKGFEPIKDPEGRRNYGRSLIEELTYKLKAGWTPFDDAPAVIYQDEVMYDNEAMIKGRTKASLKPLRSYLSMFLANEKVRIAPKTYESYKSKTRSFCQWLEMMDYDGELAFITPKIIREFFDYLIIDKCLARRTIEKYQQNLTTLFEFLIKQKLVNESPIQEIPRTGLIVDYAPKPIKQKDLVKLKEAILKEDPQLWLACLFQYYCFIRPGTELRFLKIFHIDFDAAQITVANTLAKNRRTEVVQIPDPFLEILVSEYQLDSYPDNYYVFGRDGEPGTETMGKNTMRVRFNKYRDALELSKEYKFYSWKHTGATSAVDAGIPERHLMDQLRHKSFETTDHYFRRHRGYKSEKIKLDWPEI